MPVQDLAERGEQPVGRRGEAADALDGFRDQCGRLPGVPEEVLQIGDAGTDEPVVAQLRVRPRVRTPPWTYNVWSGERVVGDQAWLPVMETAENERPW